MVKNVNYLPKGSNVLRFYIDNDDKIVKCDYLENIDGMMHEEIKLSYNELRNLFVKYIRNNRLFHEEKVYDKYILFKFYDVDLNEIYETIKISRRNQSYEYNKFKQNTVKSVHPVKRKVTRKNKFDGRKVIATIGTIAILLTTSIAILDTSINSSNMNNVSTPNEIVMSAGDLDNNYQENIPLNIEAFESENELTSETIDPVEQYDQYIEVNAEDWTSYEKYIYAKENYYDLILKYSNMYGIDPQIALAIACHERGVHSNKVDKGGGLGLYQIQIEGGFNWDNQDVYAYNFETNKNEKYTIHKETVSNLEENIKAGIMIFQECLRRNNYDVARAIQEYNYGYGNMRNVLNSCYTDKNPLTEENKLEWLSYRNVIGGGDPNYLENILKYTKNDSVFEFKCKDGSEITCKYTNLSMGSTMKK